MGFRAVARHRSKDVTLYRQGDINFIVNAEPDSHGARFARDAWPERLRHGVPRQGRGQGLSQADRRWAPRRSHNQVGPMELNIPAIEGIGGSVIYLVDRYGERSIYDVDFVPTDPAKGFAHDGAGLTAIDHVTHNVFRGNMDKWAGFYETALQLPRDPLLRHRRQADRPEVARHDEPGRQDPHSDQRKLGRQVADRGISARLSRRGHPAHRARRPTTSTHRSRRCARSGVAVPGHARHLLRAARQPHQGPWRGRGAAEARPHPDGRRADEGQDLLLQIFTQNAIGPIFFEIIQRKGNRRLRRRQFQGAVRKHRSRPDHAAACCKDTSAA